MKLADAVRVAKSVKVDHARRFATHVVPEVVRPARVIWNQAIGALFFVLALPALLKAFQLYRGLSADPKNSFSLGLSLVFSAVMIFFGAASFMKARRISRR